jgi:carbonic anhydrase/acetyltransferase-like protein (isoleucine patch superfamily)
MIIEFIGINATVLSRTRVKRGSIVAAGSVVIEDQQIEPYHLATGAPARVKKRIANHSEADLPIPVRNYLQLSAAYISLYQPKD